MAANLGPAAMASTAVCKREAVCTEDAQQALQPDTRFVHASRYTELSDYTLVTLLGSHHSANQPAAAQRASLCSSLL